MLTVSDLHQLLDRAPLHAQTVRLTQPPGGLTPAGISPTPPTSRPVVTGPRSGVGGQPRCGSTPVRLTLYATNWATCRCRPRPRPHCSRCPSEVFWSRPRS